MENNELKRFRIKNRTCYYFDDRIRCLIGLQSGMAYIFSHYFTKIKVDSYDSLPL